jgi:hypothetical protein
MALPDAARALLALPPDRFVAERDALARALAERGDRAAPEVRKLRRPIGLAWVLNRLARERRGDVEALLRAGDRLRAGHRRALSGGGAGELRAAEADLRERARALRAAAREVLREAGKRADDAALSRLELAVRLLAPAAGPDRDALREGTLAREPEPGALDMGGLAVVPGGGGSRAPGRSRGRVEAPRGAPREREDRRERAHREADARRAAAEARRRRAAAQREAARAERAAERAEAAAAAADEAARRSAERARELRGRAEAARAAAARRREALRSLGEI